MCEPGENVSCSTDCFTNTNFVCGNNVCERERGESSQNCSSDCTERTETCGNNICGYSAGENYYSCPTDCQAPSSCGNGACDYYLGESSFDCPNDCQTLSSCGDLFCSTNETPATCPSDCRTGTCNDGVCNVDETPASCPNDCRISGISFGQCASFQALQEKLDRCTQANFSPILIQTATGCPDIDCKAKAWLPEIVDNQCAPKTDSATGYVSYVCESTCPTELEGARKQCTDYGGKPIERTDYRSECAFVDCDFGNRSDAVFTGFCPSEADKLLFSAQCAREGKTAVRQVDPLNGCEFVHCEALGTESAAWDCPMISLDELQEKRSDCEQQSGLLAKTFDEQNCPVPVCVTDLASCAEPPPEAFQECAQQGGQFIVKKNDSGCTIFAECLGIPEKREFKEAKESVSEVEKLKILLDLEGLQFQIEEMRSQSQALAEYKKTTEPEHAERFERLTKLMDSVLEVIQKVRNQLEEEEITKAELEKTLMELQGLNESLKNALLVLLGQETQARENAELDCGFDEGCFQNALRSCIPAKAIRNDTLGVLQARITGFNAEEKCEINISLESGQSMTCAIADYALGYLKPQELPAVCSGELVDLLRPQLERENQQAGAGELCVGGKMETAETGETYMVCPARSATAAPPVGQGFNPTGFLVSMISWMDKK